MKTKSGYVAIIGKPNVGKSTLMNSILGERISIVTNKPQTTRKRVLGILSDEEYQIVFLDTPGILDPNYLLQKKFMEFVQNSVNDADIIVVLIDVINDKEGKNTLEDKIVKQILDKIITKRGSIITDESTNTLIISETKNRSCSSVNWSSGKYFGPIGRNSTIASTTLLMLNLSKADIGIIFWK